jgi:hypothetical protein
MKKLLSCALVASAILSCGPQLANATQIAAVGTVGRIQTYTQFGVRGAYGDVVFTLSSTAPGCTNGFWLSPGDPGLKNALAAVLLAKATAATLQVDALDTDLWSGGTLTCRVTFVTNQ